MHKIKLQFLNPDVENNYIQEQQFPKRKFYLKLCTVGLQALLITKLIFSLVEKNYLVTYPLLVTWGFTIPFSFIPVKTDIQIRINIVFLNIAYVVYLLFFDPQDEATIMYFKGSTQMAANIVNIFVLEFIESSILSFVILILRIIHLLLYSNSIDLSSILFGGLVNFILVSMLYIHHKALRSKYLLTKTDQRWENILKQIVHNQKFILINFDQDKLKFTCTTSTFSKKIQSQDEVINFIRNSKILNFTFEQYLYKTITKFQTNSVDNLNNIIMITYKRQLIKLNFSVFYGNQPTILIQKHTPLQELHYKKYSNFTQLYLQIVIFLIRIIKENKNFNSVKFQIIAKKLFLKNLVVEIYNQNFTSKTISLRKLIKNTTLLKNPNKQIQLLFKDLIFTTIPKIFHIYLAFIFECSNNELILVKVEQNKNNEILTLQFFGAFNCEKLRIYVQKFEYYLFLIFRNIKCEEKKVTIQLNSEIFIPYKYFSQNNTSLDANYL
ncbi:unnamed protein product [Paramecium sonneborni]|uniref:Transmembrane protein n=1 Tax=Paramecium sonneborni TaxID=65129 RepID=A0A8S1QU59_9CILI|nr:unnamed protein product [Paramecium sonneborni]